MATSTVVPAPVAVLVLSGLPGSGKSTLAQSLSTSAPSNLVVHTVTFDDNLFEALAGNGSPSAEFDPSVWSEARSRSMAELGARLQSAAGAVEGADAQKGGEKRTLCIVDDNMYYRLVL